MDGWLEFYYRDNAKQLRALVRSILSRKFGRVLGKDLDERSEERRVEKECAA